MDTLQQILSSLQHLFHARERMHHTLHRFSFILLIRNLFTDLLFSTYELTQFVIFKPLKYCFEETIGFDVKASFASRPESRLIR